MQHLLHCPEVGGVADKCAADTEPGEPRQPMPPNISPDRFVGISAQQCSDDFDGQDFAVRQVGGKTPLA